MRRTLAAVAALALVAVSIYGCGKSSGSGPKKTTGTGTKTPTTGGSGTTTTTPPPVDPPPDGGWVVTEIPPAEKEIPYTSVWKVIKVRDGVFFENIRRTVIFTDPNLSGGTGHSMVADATTLIVDAVTWEFTGSEFSEAQKALKDDSHTYFKLRGTRVWNKRFSAPSGYRGEKHEYTMKVEKVVWAKPELQYYNEMTNMEDDLNARYLETVRSDPRTTVEMLKDSQKIADDLGFGLHEIKYDPTKLPFQALTEAIDRICNLLNVADKNTGDLTEAIARLKIYQEWNVFPPNPVTGDESEQAKKEAEAARKAKMETSVSLLRQRLKGGKLTLRPEDAEAILKETNPTLTVQLANYAAEAGLSRLTWELDMAVFGTNEDARWKRTALSTLKHSIVSNAKFFDEFPPEALAALPGKFGPRVKEFTQGDMMSSRNAVGVLEELKRRKPDLKCDPSIDAVIAELKKK